MADEQEKAEFSVEEVELEMELEGIGNVAAGLEDIATAEELGDADRWEELINPDAFPFGRPKHPEEVAALAAMLASPKVQYLSGTVVDMDGGGQWNPS